MPAEPAATSDDYGAIGGSAGASLAGRFRVLPNSPIPELDAPGSKAFVAQDLETPSNARFARVCLPGVQPRKDILPRLAQQRDAPVMRPLDWGVIEWPPLERSCFCVVFERPTGGPLVPAGSETFRPIPVEELTKRVLAPLVLALARLSRLSIVHRAIRPDNIFIAGEAKSTLLGECVTTPPGFAQHAAFETIEGGMAPPLARGPGQLADDLYALGATIMALALGRIPLAGLSPDEIVAAKLERGSFMALHGSERVPFALREALRGLLADNTKERWKLQDLEQWLSGGAHKSSHDSAETRMDRPFTFKGKEYWGFRAIAHGFSTDWRAAATTILDDQFGKWVSRGLADADLAEETAKTIRNARIEAAAHQTADPALVTQICAILDPQGPLRYKSIVAEPDGLGPLFAQAMRDADRDTAQHVCEILGKGVAINWITWNAKGGNHDLALKLRPYKQLQQLLHHSGPGYGSERCLYELNPELPCQSKVVEPYYVDSVAELLPTLESVVRKTGRLPVVFDRHFAAFIASRIKRNFDRDFAALDEAGTEAAPTKLLMVKLFAGLQHDYGPASLPQLCGWLAKDLDPVVDRFASRGLRDQVRRKLASLAGTGNLAAVYNALTDKTLVERDKAGWAAARRQFNETRNRIARLERGDFDEASRVAGWRLSAWLGMGCAAISAVVVLLY